MKIEATTSQAALLVKMQSMQTLAAEGIEIAPESGAEGSFGSVMQQTIQNVNAEQNLASQMMSAVDSGQSDDLVGAMVASQKASLSFATLMQVRNKLMTGLDDIMRLPL
jgi:flagellar hook-basal body complex protein FliE